MNKKTLKEIPVRAIKGSFQEFEHQNHSRMYFINSYIHKNLLILDIYNDFTLLLYRIFQTKNSFITWDNQADKWRDSKLDNLFSYYPYPHFITDVESSAIMAKYLETTEDPLKAFKELQNDIRREELESKYKTEYDIVNNYMKHIRSLPKDFETWLNDVALIDSRYVVYEYKAGKTMKGKCTHCSNDVLIQKPKHNAKGKCPACNSVVVFKARGKFKNIIDETTAQIIQKHPLGLVVREYKVIKRYFSLENSKLEFFERNRKIVGKENVDFAWDVYKMSGVVKWCRDKLWDQSPGAIYRKNLNRTMKGTIFQYSGLIEFIDSCDHRIDASKYLRTYSVGPALEYLSKLKLHNLIIGILFENRYGINKDIDLRGKNPLEVLKLNKHGVNRAIKLNVNINELQLLQFLEGKQISIPDEGIKEVATDYSYQIEDFVSMMKLSNYYQLTKYLTDKKVNFRDYRDYIDMSIKLGWDVTSRFILFPRRFKEAHDQAARMIKTKTSIEDNKVIKAFNEKMNHFYNFETKDYLIRLPVNAKEIVREGHELHHCVGSYVQRVVSGKTIICFLRAKNDQHTPFYTIEIRPESHEIIQVRGNKNKALTDDLQKVVDKYEQSLKSSRIDKAS